MGWTKRQFVVQAFDEIGYAAYQFDLEPDQLQTAMYRLDAMMATWNGKGIRLGYPLPSSPELADLDTETNVPDSANEAIYTNLAIRIAPSVGKTVSQDTKTAAREAYRVLLSRAAMPGEQQLPETMPRGAGNKPWDLDSTFVDPPDDPLLAGEDGPIDFY